MNTLSWLIYLADLVENLDWFLSAVTSMALVVLALSLICGAFMAGDEAGPPAWVAWRRFVFWTPIVLSVSLILGSIVPNKNTVYAIAASEMGERALTSETGSRAFRALNLWLDRQIADEPEPAQGNNVTSNSH